MKDDNAKVNKVRRNLVRKAVYAAPAILALSAMPFTASYGSQPVRDAKSWDKPFEPGKPFDKRGKPFNKPGKPR
jgi:hypothetical protein